MRITAKCAKAYSGQHRPKAGLAATSVGGGTTMAALAVQMSPRLGTAQCARLSDYSS